MGSCTSAKQIGAASARTAYGRGMLLAAAQAHPTAWWWVGDTAFVGLLVLAGISAVRSDRRRPMRQRYLPLIPPEFVRKSFVPTWAKLNFLAGFAAFVALTAMGSGAAWVAFFLVPAPAFIWLRRQHVAWTLDVVERVQASAGSRSPEELRSLVMALQLKYGTRAMRPLRELAPDVADWKP